MGIEYSAKLVVGLPYNEISDLFSDDVAGDCYKMGLEYISPYYGAPEQHWIIGFKVAKTDDYDWCNVDTNQIDIAIARFLQITKKHGELILSPHGH